MVKDFEHFRPSTFEEAFRLLSQYKEESRVIAGGQSLAVLMKHGLISPKYVIDLKGISSLDYIDFDKNEGLRIGSMTLNRTIETSSVIQNHFGVLAEMVQELHSIQVRNAGTIGGNLCEADPRGDPATVLIALNGKVKMVSLSGERTMAVEEFLKDYFETALQADEILAEIQVPNPPPRTGTAYTKFSLINHGRAIVSTAVSITLNPRNETCSDARIVLGAVAPVAMRAEKAEKVLIGKEIKDNLLEEAGQLASEEANPISEIYASEEYKRELVKVLVKRVAREALERAERT